MLPFFFFKASQLFTSFLALFSLLCDSGVSISLLTLLWGRCPFSDDPWGYPASALPLLPEGLQKWQCIPTALHEAPGTRHQAIPIFSLFFFFKHGYWGQGWARQIIWAEIIICICLQKLIEFIYVPCTSLDARDLVVNKANNTIKHEEYCVGESIGYRKSHSYSGCLVRLPERSVCCSIPEGWIRLSQMK